MFILEIRAQWNMIYSVLFYLYLRMLTSDRLFLILFCSKNWNWIKPDNGPWFHLNSETRHLAEQRRCYHLMPCIQHPHSSHESVAYVFLCNFDYYFECCLSPTGQKARQNYSNDFKCPHHSKRWMAFLGTTSHIFKQPFKNRSTLKNPGLVFLVVKKQRTIVEWRGYWH